MMSQSSYPIPLWMFGAVQNVESGGNPNAVSPAGAGGLMQIMPDTARQPGYGVQPLQGWDGVDPRTAPQTEQQRFGNDYLQAMFNHFQGNQANALMAYNGGPGRVDKVVNGQMSPDQLPAETQAYPGKVMGGDKQYVQNENIQTDASPQPSKMSLMLEAEKRGILPPDKMALLTEARRRGLIDGGHPQQSQESQNPFVNSQAGKYFDAGVANAGAPFKPIINDTLESLKDTATETGQAVFEPYNESNVPGLMVPFDVGMKTLGKAGNAIGGAGQAIFSPVIGGLTASAESTMPLQEKVLGVNPGDLTSEKEHQIAQTEGGISAGGVGAAMGANAKTSMTTPLPKPYDPLQPMLDKMGEMSANTNPRAGFMESNSSDPFAASAPKIPSIDELYSKSNEKYDAADSVGGILNPQAVDRGIAQATKDAGYQSEEGRDFSGESDVAKALNDLSRRSGKPLSLKGAQEIDEDLSDRIDSHFDKINGMDKQGLKLLKIQQALRDTYRNSGEGDMVGGREGFDTWKEGQQLWSAARHSDDIQRILDRGENADAPSTVYKNGFKALSQNKARMRGFTPEEQDAINHAAKTGIIIPILKTVGSKWTSGIAGGVGGAMGGGFLGGLGGMVAGEAVGFPFRAGANALARGRGSNVLDLIGQRPEVQSAFNPKYPPIGFSGQ